MIDEEEAKRWLGENSVIGNILPDGIVIKCGHAEWDTQFVPLRSFDPEVVYQACLPCYHRMVGFFIDEIKEFRMKVR